MAAPLLAGKALLTGIKWGRKAFSTWKANKVSRQGTAGKTGGTKSPLISGDYLKNLFGKSASTFTSGNFSAGYSPEGGVSASYGGGTPDESSRAVKKDNTLLYAGAAIALLLMLKK